MIDTFRREQFEQVLTNAGFQFDDLGWIGGERCYHVPLDAQSGIRIRSSIKLNGQSASAGEDSIRAYLVSNGKPLASKEVTGQERWVTRVPGWETRLIATIEKLRVFRQALGNCRVCNAPNQALVSHTAKNPGRAFTKCSKCGQWGTWLSESLLDDTWDQQRIEILNSIPESPNTPAKVAFMKSLHESPEGNDNPNSSFLSDPQPAESPESPSEPVVSKPFTPSPYQEAIRDFVLNDKRALRVEAYAGSGKTSTNAYVCRALDESRGKVKMMVFSKANQLDMQAKIPEWIPATTTHSAGFADIRRIYRNVKVDERKTLNLFKQMFERDYEMRENYPAVAKLVSLCKNTLQSPSCQNLDELCERYDVPVNGSREDIYEAVEDALRESEKQTSIVDFDDMLWFPASGKVPVEKCDLLFVDEYQDNNKAQEQYYLKTGARIIFVGDARQAIYGFRGAMIGAMDRMQTNLRAEQLPLPISYRCAKSIIALAQTIVPQIQARDNAPDGIVGDCSNLSGIKSGDMVLCRNNAPLVKPCFELIRAGTKATIKGRDIGTNLMNLVHKVERREHPGLFLDLLREIQNYANEQSAKLTLQHKEAQAASLQDQAETIFALAESCHSVEDLERRVKTIFSDDVQGVVFSTIHKAKGLESDRVFVLEPRLLSPQKYDTRDWQLEQLSNLTYVCYTRAKNELRFVRG